MAKTVTKTSRYISRSAKVTGEGAGSVVSGGGGGVSVHSMLTQLDYATAGHIGFAPIDSPVFTTQITSPILYGSSVANGDITIRGTSNGTKTTSYVILQDTGGNVGVGTSIPPDKLSVRGGIQKQTSTGIDTVYDNLIKYGHYSDLESGTTAINRWHGIDATITAGAAIDNKMKFRLYHGSNDNAVPIDVMTLQGDGTVIFESDLSSPSFSAGFSGSGFKLDLNTDYTLTIDNLVVRKAMTVYELNINKINSVNGGLMVSVANGTSISVSGTTIYFDEDNGNNQIQFAIDDYIRAQIWTGRGVASYIGKVTSVTHSNTYGVANIVATTISGTPWNIMQLVQIGSSSNSARQNMIYITASDTNNPFIDVLAGVNAGSFSGKQKVRLGNLTGITDTSFGALSGYGLWSDNAYLTGALYLPTAGITNEGSSASSIRLYAGDTYANRATAPFRVTQDGSLTAVGVAEFGTRVNVSYGNVAIKEYIIWNNGMANDTSGIEINSKGYSGGLDYFRTFSICDGKGSGSGHNMFLIQPGTDHIYVTLGDINVTEDKLQFDVYGNLSVYNQVRFLDSYLNFSNIPTSSAGLNIGDVYRDGNYLKII
jgi:hypothetical protein